MYRSHVLICGGTGCTSSNSQKIIEAMEAEIAAKGLQELAANGPEVDKFNMAIENFKKNIPETRISNSYWMSNISEYLEHGYDYDAEYEAAVNSVTPEDVKAVLQAVLAQNNLIEITSAPKE